MQRFTVINRNEINFCIGWLFDDLDINKSDTRKDIISSFFDLVDWGLIELANDIDREKFNRNTRVTTYAVSYEDNYTMIYDTEIDKIFNLDIDFRVKKTMIFLYCNIASRIDGKGYCYPSFESFKSDIGTTSDNRINDALILLKDNKLIDYENVGQILVNKQVQQGNNIYVICVDKDYKDNLSKGLANRKKDYEENKVTIFEGAKSNNQRGLKQKLNHLWKKYNDGTITDNELIELKSKEEEYYNLIKLDKEKLDKINFVSFEVVEEKKEETKGYFGKPNPMKVDMETGEILESESIEFMKKHKDNFKDLFG